MSIKIAIQNKGRLQDPSLEFLRSVGLNFKKSSRDLLSKCSNADVELLYVRNGDVPVYVQQNVADFGIVGENVLIERQSNLKIIKRLGFGRCSLVIAVPLKNGVKAIEDLEGERIATSYPNTLRKFLLTRGINASVIDIRGSVEIAPVLNLADAVCDITQTGSTLKENGLEVIEKIFDSEAVLVKCPITNLNNYEEVLFK